MYVEQVEELSGGGGYTIHLSYRVVVEEVIHPVEEVILLLRFYCHPQSQLGLGFRDWDWGLTIKIKFWYIQYLTLGN